MKRCSGLFFGLLDCWSSEGLFSLEPLEHRLFWVKTPFNRTCLFSLFICRLSWRRRKGELKSSTSERQNTQWNCWKGESDTVVVLTRFQASQEAPRSISLSVGSRHRTRVVGLFHSPSLMLPWDLPEAVSLSSPGESVRAENRGSQRWQCYDNAAAAQTWPFTITGQRPLKNPNKGAMNGENCRKRSFLHVLKEREFIATRNQSDHWRSQSVLIPLLYICTIFNKPAACLLSSHLLGLSWLLKSELSFYPPAVIIDHRHMKLINWVCFPALIQTVLPLRA